MSISSIQMAIDRLVREITNREKKLSDSYRKESGFGTKILNTRKSITKNTSPSIVNMKQRQIDGWNNDSISEKRKQAQLMKEIAERRQKLSSQQQRLVKEQGVEQQNLFKKQERIIMEQANAFITHSSKTFVDGVDEKEYDFFISHASEDKEDVGTPLYNALTAHGAKVWYDTAIIEIGDSLRKSIDNGLARSKYGIVILSKDYMRKFWTEQELNGLFQKWAGGESKVILPIWHNISKNDVLNYSPTLADILALKTADFTINELAENILKIL